MFNGGLESVDCITEGLRLPVLIWGVKQPKVSYQPCCLQNPEACEVNLMCVEDGEVDCCTSASAWCEGVCWSTELCAVS